MVTGSKDDAGREESGIDEKNDCTVRAYAIMKGVPYLIAHTTMKYMGRKKGRGMCTHVKLYNQEFLRLNRPNMTVKTFIERIALKGKWIIQIRGHVFAVVDGDIKDINPMATLNCHVLQAWMERAK